MEEEINSRIQTIAEDFGFELTTRQLKKMTKLASELGQENTPLDEIIEEYNAAFPSEDQESPEEWEEFLEEVSKYVTDELCDDFNQFDDDLI